MVFEWLGSKISTFLDYSDVGKRGSLHFSGKYVPLTSSFPHTCTGAKFVFGENFEEHYIAFKVLPAIVFFSSFISSNPFSSFTILLKQYNCIVGSLLRLLYVQMNINMVILHLT